MTSDVLSKFSEPIVSLDDESENEHDEDANVETTAKNDSSEDQNTSSDDGNAPNPGWADSMAKILRTNKPKGKKTIVLAKARKLNEVVRKEKPVDPGFEVEGEVKEEKPDAEKLLQNKDAVKEIVTKKRKRDMASIRVKPDILDKDRERTLAKIATRGVVQLFNAVRTQQKDIESQIKEAGPLDRKRDKVLKNIDKRAFLDLLMGGKKAKSELVDNPVKKEGKSKDLKDEKPAESTWNVLRDDFMGVPTLKDWDKDDPKDDEGSEMESLGGTDSD